MTSIQRDVSASPGTNTPDASLDQIQSPMNSAMQRQAAGQSPRTPPTSTIRSKPSPPVAGGTGSGPGIGSSGARTSEGVLANFFTSLLSRHSNVGAAATNAGSAGQNSTQGSDKLGMSPKDIQSELERLARSSREALEANQSSKQRNSLPSGDAESKSTVPSDVEPTQSEKTEPQPVPASPKPSETVPPASESTPVDASTPSKQI